MQKPQLLLVLEVQQKLDEFVPLEQQSAFGTFVSAAYVQQFLERRVKVHVERGLK